MVFDLKYAVIIICCNIIGLVSSANDYEGIPCGEGPVTGICKIVPNCLSAKTALLHRKPHGLERCGFDGIIEIVCCPDSDDTPTKPDIRAPITTRKSEKACREYTNAVLANQTPGFQILGGENAELGEFPHMVALGYESDSSDGLDWKCGGSLISNRFVLTAAHCIIQRTRPIRARLGIVDLTGSDKTEPKDYGVLNITVHTQFQPRTKANDLALIELDSDVANSKYIHPCCLYPKNDNPLGFVITGWGYTTSGGDPSTVLQKATLQSVDLSECSKVYESSLQRTVISSQICAVSDDGTKDTCQGDSGGPLQVQVREDSYIYSIVGITSYGIGCGGKTPGVYTRVYSYLDWIESIVWR